MGYRLHAEIPNVKNEKCDQIEIGKQYDAKWDSFNDKWFGADRDNGFIDYLDLDEFIKELVAINNQKGDYKLYNIEKLKAMFEYAKKNKLLVYFDSY